MDWELGEPELHHHKSTDLYGTVAGAIGGRTVTTSTADEDSPVYFRDASGMVHLHGKVHPRVVRVVFPSPRPDL
jgi:hypothetical protein